MEQYQHVLEKVIIKEIITQVTPGVIILVVVGTVWLRFRRDLCSSIKRFLKSLMISLVWIAISALLILPAINTIVSVGKDITDKSYKTYSGKYYIDEDDVYTKYDSFIERWKTVKLENGDMLLCYVNNIFDDFQTLEDSYQGELVYGENSGIIVDMK